jgi:hypothetical protein
MATKKPKRPKQAKPAAAGRQITVTIKSGPEWKAWVDGLAEHVRNDVAKVIDHALVDYAAKHGYAKPAPRR